MAIVLDHRSTALGRDINSQVLKHWEFWILRNWIFSMFHSLTYQYHSDFVINFSLNDNRGKQQFEISLKQVFTSLNALMRELSDNTLAVQGFALKHLPTIIDDVITVFDPQQFRYIFLTLGSSWYILCLTSLPMVKISLSIGIR